MALALVAGCDAVRTAIVLGLSATFHLRGRVLLVVPSLPAPTGGMELNHPTW